LLRSPNTPALPTPPTRPRIATWNALLERAVMREEYCWLVIHDSRPTPCKNLLLQLLSVSKKTVPAAQADKVCPTFRAVTLRRGACQVKCPVLSTEELRRCVKHLPRVQLAHLPTPLEDAPRFAERL